MSPNGERIIRDVYIARAFKSRLRIYYDFISLLRIPCCRPYEKFGISVSSLRNIIGRLYLRNHVISQDRVSTRIKTSERVWS
jgi:hypothetical protein